MREQAALSATEITADAVNDFVADLNDETDYNQIFPDSPTNRKKSIWEKILAINEESSSNRKHDLLHIQNTVSIPKINGKHKKNVDKRSIKINGNTMIRGDGFAEFLLAKVPMYKEVVPGLESWKESKITSWHNVEGHAIQWFCIVCIDRKGIVLIVRLRIIRYMKA